MLYFSKLKIIFIYLLIIFLSYFTILNFLSPNYKFSNKKINLGLDLQGGSYLLLEVESEVLFKEELENFMVVMIKQTNLHRVFKIKKSQKIILFQEIVQ